MLTRKERDDARKRREILESALEIFAARGFHSTTMAKISKASQYPLGTIYKYFPGKKEMYHELVINRVRELGHILFEISQNPEIGVCDKLKSSLFAQAAFYRANQEVVRIYISERSNIDAVAMPKLNERVNTLHEKMVRLFQNIFDQGIEQGKFKSYPSEDMAFLFSDIVHSAAWASLFRDEDEEGLKKRLSMIFDMFTNGILN
ncbi:MAG: TetR/AcrR family transcriptional regulator [Proteobacteria bacterium]|nr:TetR/AcrR family transcriptional regulator [Desulfobacula sp.]MBU3952698.1 TetR/AcrR family transcriptional regulator [Pseudomonadota bacterium]MBU4132102.1 TetR/AcrR family transcriptional regulator [Pseudomonadota bacterium]